VRQGHAGGGKGGRAETIGRDASSIARASYLCSGVKVILGVVIGVDHVVDSPAVRADNDVRAVEASLDKTEASPRMM